LSPFSCCLAVWARGLLVVVLLRILATHSLSLNPDTDFVTLFLISSFPVLTSSTYFIVFPALSDSTNVGSNVRCVVAYSTATNTGNFFFFLFSSLVFLNSGFGDDGLGGVVVKSVVDGVADSVVVTSSGKGVKGLKLSRERRVSTDRV